jgi:hypothetical protein
VELLLIEVHRGLNDKKNPVWVSAQRLLCTKAGPGSVVMNTIPSDSNAEVPFNAFSKMFSDELSLEGAKIAIQLQTVLSI